MSRWQPEFNSPLSRRGETRVANIAIHQPIDFRIAKVLQAIDHNSSTSIPYLAGLANLSGSRLRHLFTAQIGMSLKSFLTDRRLNRAAFFLQTTQMTIKEISYLSGYSQSPNFVRAFHKKFRCSPTCYRNQQRQPIVLQNSLFG
jgi:AraC family transcriptional regulator, arabinose operon regulatory protein